MSDPAEEEFENLLARVAELQSKRRVTRATELVFSVTDEGAVSVHGLGRLPVTLHYHEWLSLLNDGDRLRTFLEENKDQLKGA